MLSNKRALILGVANDKSLAFEIAKIFKANGANVGITYGAHSNEKRVSPLSNDLKTDFCQFLDVRDETSWDNLFNTVEKKWGKVDILIHSIAYASPESLSSGLMGLKLNDYLEAQNISCYSFIKAAQIFSSLLTPMSSIITLTNNGSQKVVPGYGVMGLAKASLETSIKYLAYELGGKKIRVNAISAGPVKTLSAMGVSNFNNYLDLVEKKSALQENIKGVDVANLALFLSSDLSTKITGTIHYVDAGISILGG